MAYELNGRGYTAVCNYPLPNIAYHDETLHFGRYSRLRQKFLKENHGGVYSEMLLSGSLWEHLAEIESACQTRLKRIISALAESEGVTESLKASDQLEWICKMSNVRSRAEEIILSELIYTLYKLPSSKTLEGGFLFILASRLVNIKPILALRAAKKIVRAFRLKNFIAVLAKPQRVFLIGQHRAEHHLNHKQ